MQEFALILITILPIEILFRLPLAPLVRQLTIVMRKILRVLSSRVISDHWKEKVLLAYAGQMALISLKILLLVFLVGVVVLFASLVVDILLPTPDGMLGIFSTTKGLALVSVTSVIYMAVRIRFAR